MAVRYICDSTANLIKWPFQSRQNFLATAAGATAAFATKQFAQSPYLVAILTGLTAALTLANRLISHEQTIQRTNHALELQNLEEIHARETEILRSENQRLTETISIHQEVESFINRTSAPSTPLSPHEKKIIAAQRIKLLLHYSKEQMLANMTHEIVSGVLQVRLEDIPFNESLEIMNIDKRVFESLWDFNPVSYQGRLRMFLEIIPVEHRPHFQLAIQEQPPAYEEEPGDAARPV